MMLIFILLFSIVFLGNLSIFLALGFLWLRPHRTKLFFSYSHRDSELAERLMDALNAYHFRVWIDFGVEIPPDKLQKKLGRLIKRRQMMLVLASRNSIESDWVKFEIEEARKPAKSIMGQWRDTIVLTVDSHGVEMFEWLKDFYDELTLACWIKEKDLKTEEEIAKMARDLEELRRAGANQPFMRRIFIPIVKRVDFQRPFEIAKQELTEYLDTNALVGRLHPSRAKFTKTLAAGFMIYSLAIAIVSGSLLLVLLLLFLL